MSRVRGRASQNDVNLWIVPLKMSLGALLLFVLTMIPDMLAAYHVIHLPDWFSMGGIDDARAILGAMLGCVSTVLALIFSVALLVLSMVANLFGPRLLYRFVQDWVTQATIGLFMAAFIYVFLVFLVTHQDAHTSFIPQVSLITSWFVVLAAFSFLVFYTHRVASSIQNPDAIARIVDDLRRAVGAAAATSEAHRPARILEEVAAEEGVVKRAILSPVSGYMQEVHHSALIAAAADAGAVIEIPFRPGQFVFAGEPIATISSTADSDSLTAPVLKHVTLGRHRLLSQDLEFGIAQIVEIAIRALSPAINDTFTGIACVDLLGDSLIFLAEARLGDGRWYSADGKLRLRVRPLHLDRLVKQAFDQVRQAAADNPAVQIRLLTTIGRLATRLPVAEMRAALIEQSRAIRETALARITVKMDLEDIDAAWRIAELHLAASADI